MVKVDVEEKVVIVLHSEAKFLERRMPQDLLTVIPGRFFEGVKYRSRLFYYHFAVTHPRLFVKRMALLRTLISFALLIRRE